jgi:microcompartment protein CcmK/EutM
MTNLVSNIGVVANDTTGVGTARQYLMAAGYGSDKAIFAYGYSGAVLSMTNLVNNTGVVATDTTGVGTARWQLAAAGYSTT